MNRAKSTIKLGPRHRSSYETLSQYHKRLAREKREIKEHLRGRMIYPSRIYLPHAAGKGYYSKTNEPYKRPNAATQEITSE